MKSKKGGPISKLPKAPVEQTTTNNLTNAQQQMVSNQQQQSQLPVQNSQFAQQSQFNSLFGQPPQQFPINNAPQTQPVLQGGSLFGQQAQQMQVPNQYAQFPPQQAFQQNTVQQVQGPIWGRRPQQSNQAPKHP